MDERVKIDGRRPAVRVALAAVVLLTFLTCWFAVRWQLANLLATVTRPTDQSAADIARTAIAWSPQDPSAWAHAASSQNSLAVEHFSHAVLLAPNDYRWRIEHGRALEQRAQYEEAETQFRKAVGLAPSYAKPRWHLGNFLLRREREVEAFAEFKVAAANDFDYRNQVFSLAWEYYQKDAGKLSELAGETDEGAARLSFFLASRGRGDESLAAWQRIAVPAPYDALRGEIAEGLFLQGQFRSALYFEREYGANGTASVGAVSNGSFEANLTPESRSRFGWVLSEPDSKIEISPDSRIRRDGERSLRVAFRNFTRLETPHLSQTVAVEPSIAYRLSFWLRTENLRTGSSLVVDVVNTDVGSPLGRAPLVATPVPDWTLVTVEFRTPQNCQGILIRTGRLPCGDDCAVSGVIWYDGFELNKIKA
ncbi:MAG: hypothetical protein WKF34_10635 [Pyrinomonadaceae bacterium]